MKLNVDNPVRGKRRPLRVESVESVLARLRDARTRLRLGLTPLEELDVLLDDAATELDTASEIAATTLAMSSRVSGGVGHGELVWVPKESLPEVLEIISDDDDEWEGT